MDEAACMGLPAPWFFPDDVRLAHRAHAVCHTCPVQTECLLHALTHHIEYGIWGGAIPRVRKELGLALGIKQGET